MAHPQPRQEIPTHLTFEQFEKFVLSHLHTGSRGPFQLLLHAHMIAGGELLLLVRI
jgi:hypothetical protein